MDLRRKEINELLEKGVFLTRALLTKLSTLVLIELLKS
jgi:hypothetical protein